MKKNIKKMKEDAFFAPLALFEPIIRENYKACFEQYALSELDDSESVLEAYASKHRLSVFEMFKRFSEIFEKPLTDLELYAFEELFELQHLSIEELERNGKEYLNLQNLLADIHNMGSELIIFLFLCFRNSMETILNDDEKLEEVLDVFFKIYLLLSAQFKLSRELCHLKFMRFASMVFKLYLIEELSDKKMPLFIEKSSDFIEFAKILNTQKSSSNQTVIFNFK